MDNLRLTANNRNRKKPQPQNRNRKKTATAKNRNRKKPQPQIPATAKKPHYFTRNRTQNFAVTRKKPQPQKTAPFHPQPAAKFCGYPQKTATAKNRTISPATGRKILRLNAKNRPLFAVDAVAVNRITASHLCCHVNLSCHPVLSGSGSAEVRLNFSHEIFNESIILTFREPRGPNRTHDV